MDDNYDVSVHSSSNNHICLWKMHHLLKKIAFVFIPIAKTLWYKTNDVAPIAMVKVKTINRIQVDRPLVCLLDTGSTERMIQIRALSPSAVPNISLEKRITTTSNGSFDTSRSVELRKIQLPEFVNRQVGGDVEARLFHSLEWQYDIIFGRDLLRSAQM